MAPSPQTVTTKPLFLNANSGVHKADDLRKITDDVYAVGVEDINSFKVRQRVAGANMSVDVTDAATISRAYVRGSLGNDQGVYRVDNVDDGVIAALVNVDIGTADPTNPRIDQVFLVVEDAQYGGSNNIATVRVVAGTATGGATLDNRTGAGAAPANSILLADVLVAAAVGSILTAAIRDRRPVANFGTVPWLGAVGTQIDAVAFVAHPAAKLGSSGVIAGSGAALQGTSDNFQSAALMFLPRRIVGATKFRWKYRQGGTANANGVVVFIADASGRVVSSVSTTFTGAAGQTVEAVFVITALTLEAGWYYVGIGVAAMTAASSMGWDGVQLVTGTVGVGLGVGSRNIGLKSTTGGSTAPTTIAAYTDVASVAADVATLPVPIPVLSVT